MQESVSREVEAPAETTALKQISPEASASQIMVTESTHVTDFISQRFLYFSRLTFLAVFGSTVLASLIVLSSVGCNSTEPENVADVDEIPPANPISVVFVDIPDIAANVARQWSARRGSEANIKNITADQLLSDHYQAIEGQDIIVYPSFLVGQLVADKKINELSQEIWGDPEYNNRGLLRDGRSYQVKLDGKPWGCPLGSPNYFLICRNEAIMESDKLPDDWESLVEFATGLREKGSLETTNGDTINANILAPLAGHYAAHSFLTVAATRVRHRGKIDFVFERQTMKPLIAAEPYVLALQQLKAIVGQTELRLTPKEVLQKYAANQATMILGWPAKAFLFDQEFDLEILADSTTLGRLPGSKRWFDFGSGEWSDIEEIQHVGNVAFAGYQASMLTSANYPTTAYEFLSWIGDKKTSASIMSNSVAGAPSRELHLGNVPNWTGDLLTVENSDRYAEIVSAINKEPVLLMFPRIPATDRYLSCLADEVAEFLASDVDAKQTLQNVAERWETITDEIGRDSQIENLRADFGL